jgi:Family of unknown function (DUF6152)
MITLASIRALTPELPRGRLCATAEVSEMKAGVIQSTVLLAIGAVLFATVPLAAHHSFSAEYDAATMVTLKGVVSRVEWSNPHIHIYVDVTDQSGKVSTWDMEGAPPNALIRKGLTSNFVKVGDTITITGSRARDNSTRASRGEVTTADGKKYNFGGAGEFQFVH